MAYKKISIGILGSTGSIGRTSLSILEKYRKNFSIDLLSCQKNIHIIDKQIKNFSPKFVLYWDNLYFCFISYVMMCSWPERSRYGHGATVWEVHHRGDSESWT